MKNRNSIVVRIGALMLLVVVLQALISAGSVLFTRVPETLEGFSWSLFVKTVENRGNFLQSNMIDNWSDLDPYPDAITAEYETIRAEDGSMSEEDKVRFFEHCMEPLRDLMIQSDSIGSFILLDDAAGIEGSHSTLYLRSNNYASSIESFDSLTLLRGPTEVSHAYQVPLANMWSYGLTLDASSEDILTAPLAAITQSDNPAHWGYWDIIPDIVNPEARVIVYTIPLLGDDGAAIGVLGIEVSQDYLYKSLPFGEFSEEGSYGYMLVSYDEESGTVLPRMTQGTLQKTFARLDAPLSLQAATNNPEESKAYVVETDIAKLAVSLQPLALYASNSPFEENHLYLMGLTEYANIRSFSDDLYESLFVLVIVSTGLGLVVAYYAGHRFTEPILRLRRQVLSHPPDQKASFVRTNFAEIDDLAGSIEQLQHSILDAAHKTDTILEMMDIGVGSFEQAEGADYVTVSGTLRAMLALPIAEGSSAVPKALFYERLDAVKAQPEEDFPHVYVLQEETRERFVRILETVREESRLGVVMDVTKEVLEQRSLRYERDYDMLTGLYNRLAFHRECRSIFAERGLEVAAVMMFDLDNLKYVNDSFGHETGDLYLKTTAQFLRTTFDRQSVVGRMSGDEFYVFLHGFASQKAITDEVRELYHRMEQEPILLPDGSAFQVRMSGGLAWFGEDSEDFDELLRYADFAMYYGKHNLKGELRFFDAEIYRAESFMLSGREELNRVLDNEFVQFAFQPIVDAKTGDIYAYEALMRPESKLLDTPLKLLQIATAQSKLWKIERITFFKTLALYEQHRALFGEARLFINSIPNRSLKESEYQELERLYGNYLPKLVVEIIESEQFDTGSLEQKLSKISSWGAHIALDDYGAGYNNDLGILHINPYIVKLDRSLLTNIDTDSTRQAIVSKIQGFCRQQGILVLAEGVETREELRYLLEIGVDFLQGYYIAKPLPKPDFDNRTIAAEITAYREETATLPV